MDSPGGIERVVLHVDMDAFFAAVEVRDDPSLFGLAVIVGGPGPRGVVAACTYEARRFGVRSAMPTSTARRLCPDAVVIAGRYERYAEESRRLHAIFDSVTPVVEGIGLDEAFLELTGRTGRTGVWPDGRSVAWAVRDRVGEELRLACSVGVGRSKLIAKLASKAAKPVATPAGIVAGPGVVVVPRTEELAFLDRLPVRALWGIGPVTGRRLEQLGITRVEEIRKLPDGSLARALGCSQAEQLSALARAVDPRPVVGDREAKSVGHEETFIEDLYDRGRLDRLLMVMTEASATALRRRSRAARTVTVKLRFGDFTTVTRTRSLAYPIDVAQAIGAVAASLLDSCAIDRGVRLLGVSLSGLVERGSGSQLALDLGDERTETASGAAARLQQSWGSVTEATDAVRARYGPAAVGPTSLIGPEGLDVHVRGAAPWGPARSPHQSPSA